jgi:chromosome segregation ATPase
MQERESLLGASEESRKCQHRLDEVQRALRIVSDERDTQVRQTESARSLLASKDEEVEALAKQKTEMTALIRNLEASLKDMDNKRQLELLQTQYEQVRDHPFCHTFKKHPMVSEKSS